MPKRMPARDVALQTWWRAVAYACCFASAWRSSEAKRILIDNFSTDDPIAWFPGLESGWGPGLAPGAVFSAKLTIDQPAPNAAVLLLSDAQFNIFLRLNPTITPNSMPRSPRTLTPSSWRASLGSDVVSVHHIDATEPTLYYGVIVQGPNSTIRGLQGEITYENPGGEHLPWQYIHYPAVFFAVSWINAVAVVCMLLAVLSRWRSKSKLHALIALTGTLKAISLYQSYALFREWSETGMEDIWHRFYVQLFEEFTMDIRLSMFYVIGLGWKVIRPYLRPSEMTWCLTLILLSVVLTALKLRSQLFGIGDPKVWALVRYTLHSFCYVIVVCAIHFNIFILQRQILEALAAPDSGELYVKIHAYSWFKWFFLLHIISDTITNAVTLHLEWYERYWIGILTRELLECVVLTAIMVLFCPSGLQPLRIFELAVVESSDSSDGSDDSME